MVNDAEVKRILAKAFVIALILPGISIYLLAGTRLPMPLVAFAQLGYCWYAGVFLALALAKAMLGDES